ncbi:MAG TPA: M28 family peptidase [Methylomirabilota bacterium]|nr:M28 family peptidase [Methylomirabilota bacterium]
MGDDSPAALARLLCGRDNPAREAALPRYLQYRGIAFARHRFTRPQGRGDNYAVELGEGPRVLVLCAHHDAIPGSPGANDNAAAVGILLHLIPRLPSRIARGWRVRLLFTAAEELDYLGARAYVEDTALADVAGVLSLELCGIGDTVAVWDAVEPTPLLGGVTGALESIGLAREAGYHVVGRIPMFGSDHRAFAAAAIPAYGFTMVPAAHAAALRRFVLSPLRSSVRSLIRRPPPFDTYHTSDDALETLEPVALHRAAAALTAVVAGLDRIPTV